MRHRPKRKLYVAGPLFSEAELQFNAALKRDLSGVFEVYLPQEDGHLIVDLIQRGVPIPVARRSIFQADCSAITDSDTCLIILDGRSVDEGAAFELGLAYALGKQCIGLQTDSRRLLVHGNNPMIDEALDRVFRSAEAICAWEQETRSASPVVRTESLRPEVKAAPSSPGATQQCL